jgi:tripartite-type tricarboxylate transporter receptor subunit TctC
MRRTCSGLGQSQVAQLIASAALSLCLAGAAYAQAYPAKPVRLFAGYAPGGGVDTGARLVANAMADLWGSSVIVENRPGAAGSIATEIVAKATADGYTLLLCTVASHAITPARNKNLPYDHIRDFTPISMVGTTPNLLVVHPSLPVKTVGELIARAKANPGKLNYGTSGVGASPHLSVELLMLMTGIQMVHVPYKGAAPALADAIGGQIQVMIGNMAGGPLGAARSGKVHPLGVTSAKRSPQLPDVPAIGETVPGYDVVSWYGICAPGGLPGPLLTKLNADLVKVLQTPDLQRRLADQGIDAVSSTPSEFVAYIRSETAKWVKVVRDANIPPE